MAGDVYRLHSQGVPDMLLVRLARAGVIERLDSASYARRMQAKQQGNGADDFVDPSPMHSEGATRAAAFCDRWIEKFHDVYQERELKDITWFTGTVSMELMRLVTDQTIRRGSRVVDLGCGPGVESLFLATHGMQVTGVDLSLPALKIARVQQAISNVPVAWVNGDILHLPLVSGFADMVNDSFIFHNIRPDFRRRYAANVFRILKPGGLFLMRGYSDRMSPGSGPYRLNSSDILDTFLDWFEVEKLERLRGLPTEKRPGQWHWVALFRPRTMPQSRAGRSPWSIGPAGT